jgi:hypothetical protein
MTQIAFKVTHWAPYLAYRLKNQTWERPENIKIDELHFIPGKLNLTDHLVNNF